jgi:undecaprenyl-phosphate 4-deoxy-4-formamido-L-arabinose transferase
MSEAGFPGISVVIPVYHSERTLAVLAERLARALAGVPGGWEAVFVDDGSLDGSWTVLERLHAEDPGRVRAIRLARNFGQHNALMCGFRAARGAVVVTMDDDLQNPPEEIPKLLSALAERNLDVVYGRYESKRHRRWRNAGSWIVNAFYRRVFRTGVTVSAFRAIRRETLENVLGYDLNFTFVDGLLAWNTQRIGEVAVEHHVRHEGRSGYNIGRLLTLAFNLFTNFSLIPLQVVMGVGLLLAGTGFAVGLWYLVAFFRQQIAVPGYASTITAILVLGGAQLVGLGVIGEYLGRLHMNVNRKPQYSVRTRLEAARIEETSVVDELRTT